MAEEKQHQGVFHHHKSDEKPVEAGGFVFHESNQERGRRG
jgi:hypothetical protein